MRYFSAECARMYRFSANSRATISSTAIFLSQQSRQYFSSPRGSETSFAPQRAQRDCARDLRSIHRLLYQLPTPPLPIPTALGLEPWGPGSGDLGVGSWELALEAYLE